jgi:hypothetical protein
MPFGDIFAGLVTRVVARALDIVFLAGVAFFAAAFVAVAFFAVVGMIRSPERVARLLHQP